MSWTKNQKRFDIVNRFGATVGLPLFEQTSKPVPSHIKSRLNNMPKSILTATETRKLAEMTAKADEMKLADKQQMVLDEMSLRDDWSFQELAEKLDWTVNRVIPRVHELRELGLVVASQKRVCSVTNYVVQAWRVK